MSLERYPRSPEHYNDFDQAEMYREGNPAESWRGKESWRAMEDSELQEMVRKQLDAVTEEAESWRRRESWRREEEDRLLRREEDFGQTFGFVSTRFPEASHSSSWRRPDSPDDRRY